MFESTRGRQLAKLLAVLLGVVLWWPALGPELAQPSTPELACADAGSEPVRDIEQSDIAPGEIGEEGENPESEDAYGGPLFLAISHRRLSLASAGATHIAARSRAYIQLSAGHHQLARERGPPLS